MFVKPYMVFLNDFPTENLVPCRSEEIAFCQETINNIDNVLGSISVHPIYFLCPQYLPRLFLHQFIPLPHYVIFWQFIYVMLQVANIQIVVCINKVDKLARGILKPYISCLTYPPRLQLRIVILLSVNTLQHSIVESSLPSLTRMSSHFLYV